MSDSKISALTSATTPLSGTEVLPIVQGGATKQVSVANLTAGRAVSAASLTMSTGSLVPSTAGQGINFTANTPAAGMTSQLLNWYEEGTWTPSQGAALTVVGAFSSIGKYTRVGRQVTVVGSLSGATSISSTTGIICGGLPFSPANTASGSAAMSSINAGSTLYIPNTNIYAVTAMAGGGGGIVFTASFFV